MHGPSNSKNEEMKLLENRTMFSFRRRCHHFIEDVPRDEEFEEWLAYMQHYGVPTRLVDWTYSFNKALFFALADLTFSSDTEQKTVSVFCVYTETLVEASKEYLKSRNKEHEKTIDDYEKHAKERKPGRFRAISEIDDIGVFQMTPNRLNPRIWAQEGTFLLQTGISKSLSDAIGEISGNAKYDDIHENDFSRVDIVVQGSKYPELMRKLRVSNISHENMYPDLHGYAEDLKRRILYEKSLETHFFR